MAVDVRVLVKQHMTVDVRILVKQHMTVDVRVLVKQHMTVDVRILVKQHMAVDKIVGVLVKQHDSRCKGFSQATYGYKENASQRYADCVIKLALKELI